MACVLAGIIVISSLWCLLRCILCGYACCACCCGGCGGRPSKRNSGTTYLLPPAPIIDRPPQPQSQPFYHNEPKFAYYDSNSDDALPHMPSARGVDVKQVVEESHEMGQVGPVDAAAGRTSPGAVSTVSSSNYSHSTSRYGPPSSYGQPAFAGGHADTAYSQDVEPNPYHYQDQGMRQQELYPPPNPSSLPNQRRLQEWTVV